jgi:hypothetical protein
MAPVIAPFPMLTREWRVPPVTGAGTAGGAVFTMLAGVRVAAGCVAALASGWLASISPPATAVISRPR